MNNAKTCFRRLFATMEGLTYTVCIVRTLSNIGNTMLWHRRIVRPKIRLLFPAPDWFAKVRPSELPGIFSDLLHIHAFHAPRIWIVDVCEHGWVSPYSIAQHKKRHFSARPRSLAGLQVPCGEFESLRTVLQGFHLA